MAYEINEAKKLIISAGKKLLKDNLVTRTWGNVSARIDDERFAITPSGRTYDDLTEKDIVIVDIRTLSHEGDITPSSEAAIHAAVYRDRSDVNFVVHTHQPNASALSVLGGHFLPVETVDREAVSIIGASIPCAEYGMAGSRKLEKAVSSAIAQNPESNAILMKNHGAVILGISYESAVEAAEKLEEVSGKFYENLTGEKILTGSRSFSVKTLKPGGKKSPSNKGIAIIHVRTPYIMKMSESGKTIYPYLDDLAQIGGVSIRCVEKNAGNQKIRDAFKGRNAILVKENGALATGDTPEEAAAVAAVLEKNCRAAYLAEKMGVPPISKAFALIDRTLYTKKYSKLKDSNR